MFRMNAAALRATLTQLQQATHDHLEWREHLIRTIVCRLPPRRDDLADDAHKRCGFGQWYYAEASAVLREQRILGAMEIQHEVVHRIAAAMLRKYADDRKIPSYEYDDYVAAGHRLQTELDSLRHEIQDILRSADALTGAFGRGRLLPDLREWRALAARDVQQCSLAFMDIDDLKTINDVHGHTVGDQVLAGMVDYVTQHLRPYDKVYRYGGDEFLVSLPATDLKQAEHLVDRVRAGIGTVPYVVAADGDPIHATASFGIALLDPEISVEESIDRADRALLLAKTSGRNRALSWEPGITTGTLLSWPRDEDVQR